MKIFTDKNTLLIGALSLVGGVGVSLMTNQPGPKDQLFTQPVGKAPMVYSSQNISAQKSYILQGVSRDSLVSAIESAGAKVSREFPIISAVSAMLTKEQSELLAATGIKITSDHKIQILGYSDFENAEAIFKQADALASEAEQRAKQAQELFQQAGQRAEELSKEWELAELAVERAKEAEDLVKDSEELAEDLAKEATELAKDRTKEAEELAKDAVDLTEDLGKEAEELLEVAVELRIEADKRAEDLAKELLTLKKEQDEQLQKHGDREETIDTHIGTQTGASTLHNMGITGQGVTVAVLDSGTLMQGDLGKQLLNDTHGNVRAFNKYDAIKSVTKMQLNDDKHGHGTHVSSIIASSLRDDNGHYNGIAPDAYLLSVKAFDKKGDGSYTDVLDGLNWIYQNRHRYGIRVLNLALGSKVQSNYWNDPINQAVMRLWDAGIVVVTSAGNTGSDNATITVPGNVPYIITVGAVTDSYTPDDFSDDRIASFSSRGPTHEGFVKPELVAWGGHIEVKMERANLDKSNKYRAKPSQTGEDYVAESGTSQAAAVVTGIVALMLDNDPSLSPDDVKCRLISASKAINDPGTDDKYSPFAQGAGLANAYASVMSQASGCANQGLDIQAEINGIKHFKGPTVVSQNGELMIDFGNGNVVAEGSVWGGGTLLEGSVWGGGALLEGSVWGGGTELEGSVWGGGTLLEGSVWGGGTVLEGSVWGGGAILEGSVWGGDADLEGSIWGGELNLESDDNYIPNE